MRRFAKTVVALSLATGAALGGVAVSVPAFAGGGGGGGGLIFIGGVDVNAEDIASGNQVQLLNNVSVQDAANFCQINLSVLTAALLNNQPALCPGGNNSTTQNAKATRH